MRSPSACRRGAFCLTLYAAARALLLPLAVVALPSTADGQSWLQRIRDARLEFVIYGRPYQSDANTAIDRLLGRAGFADSVYQAYSDCGFICGGMGGPSGFDWFPYPRHVDESGWSSKAITLSATLRPHVRATVLWAGAATLGGVIGGSCPNQSCYADFGYGPRYFIGIDSRVSSVALLAEGEYGWLRVGAGPAVHGVSVQSLPWIDPRVQWKERFHPAGGVASVGLTVPLWRPVVVSGRWVYSAMGDVQLSARDVSNDAAPLAAGTRRFEGGKVNLSNSYVLMGIGVQMR